MASYTKVQITHNGTVTTPQGAFTAGQAVGPIYLSDFRRRLDTLGELETTFGEDQYIEPNTTIEIPETGEIHLSAASGMLSKYIAMGVLSITFGITS